MTRSQHSSGRPTTLMLYPFANKTWAGINAEITIFAINQIQKRRPVEFLQMREVQYRPQVALGGGMNQLVQISQMPLE